MRTAEHGTMKFQVVIKKEEGLWVAHCLELDIVAANKNLASVKKEIGDLITAQVSYAFENDNVENLYRPAPAEVWEKLYGCKMRLTKKRLMIPRSARRKSATRFMPPDIIVSSCFTA